MQFHWNYSRGDFDANRRTTIAKRANRELRPKGLLGPDSYFKYLRPHGREIKDGI
jgi:hypothetical protein